MSDGYRISVQEIAVGVMPTDAEPWQPFTRATSDADDISWYTVAGRLYTEHLRWKAFPERVYDRIVVEVSILELGDIFDPPTATASYRVRFGYWESTTLKTEEGHLMVYVAVVSAPPILP